jgi:membrane associated rhomboid family serine protease
MALKGKNMSMNISKTLLAIVVIAFIFQLISVDFTWAFIFIPTIALQEPWRFVTSMFLHSPGSFYHIFFNAYALFLFGSILETRISRKDYLVIFFGAGLLGGVLYYLISLTPYVALCELGDGTLWACPALGASGAIYGLLGAVAIMLPEMRIFMLFIPMKMRYAALLWFAISFFGTFSGFGDIAHAAHLGGLIFGLVYAWFIKRNVQEFYMPPENWQE